MFTTAFEVGETTLSSSLFSLSGLVVCSMKG